jgi:BCD family chlorophyll transporter-like MFS transporter
VGSLVFLTLPTLAAGLGTHSLLATFLAFLMLAVFGLAMAANGTATFALIAEVTEERERGIVVAVTQTFLIISAIASAGVAKQMMPTYSPEQMQALYNLTPLLAVGITLPGVLGMERRISRTEHAALLAQPTVAVESKSDNAFTAALRLMQTNRQGALFFVFVLLAIMGVFLQDTILKPFGGEVFGMRLDETTSFTQIWGGGVLIGMVLIGVLTALLPLSKKLIATGGAFGAVLGLGALALASFTLRQELIHPALLLMGFSVGLFNVGAMSMMMEMTSKATPGCIWGSGRWRRQLATGLPMWSQVA